MQLILQLTSWPMFSLTGLSFIYVVLPVFCFIHKLTPAAYRPAALLALSLVYTVMAMPSAVFFLLFSILFDYSVIKLMDYSDSHGSGQARRLALFASAGKSVLLLMYLRGLDVPVFPVLGAAVVALSGTSAVFEFYRREIPSGLGLVKFGLYGAFFPRLYAGPVCSYQDFQHQLNGTEGRGVSGFFDGFGLFITGALKAGILGRQLAGISTRLLLFTPDESTVLSHWILLLTFALCVYYLLSGLSDMAVGMGIIFGFRLRGNFYYPYQSRNITDFFERFNSTVTTMLRKLLRHDELIAKSKWLTVPLLLAEGLLLGLWLGHGAQFALWGVYISVFAVMERYFYPKLVDVIPTFIGRVFSFAVVLSSFAILSAENVEGVIASFKGMFGFISRDVPFVNDKLLYLLASNWLVLAASLFFTVNLVDVIGRWLGKMLPRIGKPVYWLISLGLLVLYTALSL